VSPNAILRAINRYMAPRGLWYAFREVGTPDFPGFFYDAGDRTSTDPSLNYAYDMDFTLRPQDQHKLMLSWEEMRGFFLVCVKQTGLGEFGFSYDNHPHGAYDGSPFNDFYDGFAYLQALIYKQLFESLAPIKAAGVGYDLHLDK